MKWSKNREWQDETELTKQESQKFSLSWKMGGKYERLKLIKNKKSACMLVVLPVFDFLLGWLFSIQSRTALVFPFRARPAKIKPEL